MIAKLFLLLGLSGICSLAEPIEPASRTWPISPLYYENNIQDLGRCGWRDAQTLTQPDVVRREDDYARKITQDVRIKRTEQTVIMKARVR